MSPGLPIRRFSIASQIAILLAVPAAAGPLMQTGDGTPSFTLIRPLPPDQAARELAELRRICSFWRNRSRSDPAATTLGTVACQRMREHAGQSGLPNPKIAPAPGPRAVGSERTRTPPSPYTIQLETCERHDTGSIAWRDCRSRERQRLHRHCLAYGSRAASATGGAYLADMRGWQRAYCDAYHRYESLTQR